MVIKFFRDFDIFKPSIEMPRMEEVPDPLHHFHTLRGLARIIKE
jgi:hypothetical protein